MKKGIVTISALLAAGMLSGCGPQESGGAFLEGRSDLAYVQGKGTLVVGVTDFAPMDYREDGAWTGFDAQMAESFAQSIGVTAVFEEIDWDKKAELLQEGEIDCIWNGMTLTGPLQEEIERLSDQRPGDGAAERKSGAVSNGGGMPAPAVCGGSRVGGGGAA